MTRKSSVRGIRTLGKQIIPDGLLTSYDMCAVAALVPYMHVHSAGFPSAWRTYSRSMSIHSAPVRVALPYSWSTFAARVGFDCFPPD